MTEAMPFLQKAILLSYDPRPFGPGFFIFFCLPEPHLLSISDNCSLARTDIFCKRPYTSKHTKGTGACLRCRMSGFCLSLRNFFSMRCCYAGEKRRKWEDGGAHTKGAAGRGAHAGKVWRAGGPQRQKYLYDRMRCFRHLGAHAAAHLPGAFHLER